MRRPVYVFLCKILNLVTFNDGFVMQLFLLVSVYLMCCLASPNIRAYITRFERKSRFTVMEKVNKSRTDELHIKSRRVRSERATEITTMSRNITMVLEHLLQNYQNSQLPSQDGPTVIKTNILIRSMGPVSELDMDYSMDCYFRQYWRDSRLSFMGPIKSLSLSIKMLERIWRPDTYFYNGKQSYVHTITVPNKLLRISQEGDILYSMRLTIKAKCPMELRNFPMDSQSCPLVLGSYAYTNKNLVYQWQSGDSVSFVPGMTLSQFDLMSIPQRNLTFHRREGHFSVLQVNFNLQRNTGYFVIQIYVPCVLIVVLSWVSFWIHREATSDRVGLGITTVLTLSTISLDSRNDLPKVHYATALDWFLLMSFFYCIATLLEFASVHYFTKVGSGEIPIDEDEWEETGEVVELIGVASQDLGESSYRAQRRRSSIICPIYNDPKAFGPQRQRRDSSLRSTPTHQPVRDEEFTPKATTSRDLSDSPEDIQRRPSDVERLQPIVEYDAQLRPLEQRRATVERHTQTEKKIPKWRQFLYCLMGDDRFRKQRQRQAAMSQDGKRHINSVSYIDQAARVLFPLSFTSLNIFYWVFYLYVEYPKTSL